jgi:hypothetical protein
MTNIVTIYGPYRAFLTWKEKLARRLAQERGELADVVPFPQKPDKTDEANPPNAG